MISDELSDQVLILGCDYHPPKGGVAQVMYNYERYIYPKFKCIINSGGTNKVVKLMRAIVAFIKMIYCLCVDHKIQIVHIHTASYNSFRRSSLFVKLAKVFDKKVIIHIHGGGFKEYYKTSPSWISEILNKADIIIVLSVSWKIFFESITKGPKVCVVENIVAKPNLIKKKYNDQKLHLLFLGLVDDQKGIFDLLDVIHEHVREWKSKLTLHIGGNGQIQRLENLIKKYGLKEIVSYEGFVSGEKKKELLSSCDALILPSYTEGLPVSILEAMSYGKAVFSTPVGGIPEVIYQNDNGLLFSPGDKNAMYEIIEQSLNNRDSIINMGRNSLLHITPYLPENVCKKLESIYMSL